MSKDKLNLKRSIALIHMAWGVGIIILGIVVMAVRDFLPDVLKIEISTSGDVKIAIETVEIIVGIVLVFVGGAMIAFGAVFLNKQKPQKEMCIFLLVLNGLGVFSVSNGFQVLNTIYSLLSLALLGLCIWYLVKISKDVTQNNQGQFNNNNNQGQFNNNYNNQGQINNNQDPFNNNNNNNQQ